MVKTHSPKTNVERQFEEKNENGWRSGVKGGRYIYHVDIRPCVKVVIKLAGLGQLGMGINWR